MRAVIEFRNVSKSYLRGSGQKLLRHYLVNLFRSRGADSFQALRNISLEVKEGEGVALIGHNGAGKSTLLSLVAGLSMPDSGTVSVRGRVAALFELGSGFHPDLTGVENIYMNAALLGLSRRQTEAALDDIIAFADIGDFIREPLRTYSSGMVMRVAFAVAVCVDPEILIIDEVIAVGDQQFQEKCFDRIRRFRKEGKTLLIASHSSSVLYELCDRAVWLDHGSIIRVGEVRSVVEAHRGSIAAASVN